MTQQDARLTAAKIQPKIELAVLGFLVSLILKGTLDSIFGHSLTETTNWIEVYRLIGNSHPLELFVFLFAMLRFRYGAYRFHEELPDPTPRIRVWNLLFTVLLFIAFYLDGLSIKDHPILFYQLFAIVHLVDLVWFLPMAPRGSVRTRKPRSIAIRAATAFAVLDFLTIAASIAWLGYAGVLRGSEAPTHPLYPLAYALVLLGVIDVIWNKNFYFALPPDERPAAT